MNLKEAELVLMRNLKGRKDRTGDILGLAKAASIVRKNYTRQDIRDMYGITMTSFERLNSINRLNPRGKSLVRRGALKAEQAYHLSRVDPGRQDRVACIISSMNTSETRNFVSLVLSNPDADVDDLKAEFDRGRGGGISIVVMPMPESMYNRLSRVAKSRKKEPHDLIMELVEERLGR